MSTYTLHLYMRTSVLLVFTKISRIIQCKDIVRQHGKHQL